MLSCFVLLAAGAAPPYPNGYFYGCAPGGIATKMPFCDPGLTISARVKDLIGRLTLNEKLGLLGPNTNGTHVGSCTDMDAGVKRLGIPSYTHLVEDNSGAGSECIGPGKCATNFPGPTGLAASFNRSLWKIKGTTISTEQRAQNNLGGSRGYEAPYSLIGLTGFGPNINIARDPRFGRISELPSEDPFLAGEYAKAMVSGMQGSDPKYLKIAAALKHFTAYSEETDRMQRMVNISTFDLWDTYLPQYAAGFGAGTNASGGGVPAAMGAMCSYAGVNGVPMCANDYILNKVLRGHWGRPDAHIQSDCGAITNQLGDWVHYAKNNSDAAAKALNGGCDLDDGNMFYPPRTNGGNGGLPDAIAAGLTTEATVDAALTRVLTNERFRTGQADPLEGQAYTKIGAEVINSTDHQAANLDAALQSFVLLKAEGGVLPLKPKKSIAVVGPHAVSHRDLLSDYVVDQLCYKGPIRSGDCWPSIGEAFASMHDGDVFVESGVTMAGTLWKKNGIAEALAAVKKADQVVLAIGIGNQQEHEGIDRTDTMLPGLQESFAQQVLALGKPTTVVLINGGIVSIDSLVGKAKAIVEGFYPSTRGAEALYLTLSGRENRWGKLPVTIYPAAYTSAISLDEFDMTKAPGRTYRYYRGTPLWPFGFGLSMTEFDFTCQKGPGATAASTLIHCSVQNEGALGGDEVLMVFHRVGAGVKAQYPVPTRALVDFERVRVAAGASAAVSFSLEQAALATTTLDGDREVLPGAHFFDVTDGVKTVAIAVTASAKVTLDVVPRP